MTNPTIALLEYLRKLDLDLDGDVLREMARVLTQKVMEMEVEQQIGARRYERAPERRTQRNGYREREWHTRVGENLLRVPKVREGIHFPSLLEPRRREERALSTVVQSAYEEGVSTWKVDKTQFFNSRTASRARTSVAKGPSGSFAFSSANVPDQLSSPLVAA